MFTMGSLSESETVKIITLFGLVFAIIILLNVILANLIFSLPAEIHWALTAIFLFSFYSHFCLICIGNDTSNLYWVSGRGKLLIPMIFICHLILKLIPKVGKQEWHKHRGLIIIGPLNLLACFSIIAALHIPFSWPILFVSLFSIATGYYSISALPLVWIKFIELWEVIK